MNARNQYARNETACHYRLLVAVVALVAEEQRVVAAVAAVVVVGVAVVEQSSCGSELGLVTQEGGLIEMIGLLLIAKRMGLRPGD